MYELQHFGIKGMKWGIRKNRSPSKPKSTYHQLKKKNFASMNNETLKRKTERLNLENNYQIAMKTASQLNMSKARKVIKAARNTLSTANEINNAKHTSVQAYKNAKDAYKFIKMINTARKHEDSIELQHKGVFGMRKGIRKTYQKKDVQTYMGDYKKAQALSNKKTKERKLDNKKTAKMDDFERYVYNRKKSERIAKINAAKIAKIKQMNFNKHFKESVKKMTSVNEKVTNANVEAAIKNKKKKK